MPGFGSLAPQDWQDREAQENLAAIEAAKPKTGTWFDSVRAALSAPARITGALASTPVENADAGAMMPETTINPLVKGALDAAGHAVASGATAPGDALAGKIPAFDASGHTSPEMIARGFDTAALAGGTSAANALEKAIPETTGADVRILGRRLPWDRALASDAGKPGAAIAASEHAPVFNLSAEEALKNTARKSGTGAQWANELKRYGAKPEELDWRGASDMLTKNANVPIPRAAVEQHLAGNPLELKPIEKRQMPENWKDLSGEQQHAVMDRHIDITGHEPHDLPAWYEDIAQYSRKGNESGLDSVFDTPRYSEYQLPGGPLSRDTEIMTSEGWSRIDEIKVGDEVLTRRDLGGMLEWQQVKAVPKVYAEKLYHFFNQSIDMQVTAEHQMVIKRRRRSRQGIFRVTAAELWRMTECVVPLTGTWSGRSAPTLFGLNACDAAEFIGWFISEGSYKNRKGKKSTVQIAQCPVYNSEKCKRLEALFDRLGLSWKSYGEAYGIGVTGMPPGLVSLLHDQPTSAGKFIPPLFFKQSRKVIDALLTGLIMGDGTTIAGQKGRIDRSFYFTKSKRLAGDVQALVALSGKRASVRQRPSGLYVVAINIKQWSSVDDAKYDIVPYNDTAFCVTVENHAIYVRRNGVAAFTGNSNYRERLLTLPEKNPFSGEAVRKYHGLSTDEWDSMKASQQKEMKLQMARAEGIDPSKDVLPFTGNHWEEPNVLVHRRTTDRTFPEPLTAEEQAAVDTRRAAQGQLNGVRQQQNIVARDINKTSAPLERSHFDQIYKDLADGKITVGDMRRAMEQPFYHPELKPLQDKLQELRAQEDAIRNGMPPAPQPKTSKSVHAEEIQSDWHQAGQNTGYRGSETSQQKALMSERDQLAEKAAARQHEVADYGRDPEYIRAMDRITEINDQLKQPYGDTRVPDAPFKDSWHRLALNDMIREAAEKGADEISWTAGRSHPTNPKNLGQSGGAEAERAEAGLIKHYDERLVNAANKIGKQHGVQVEKGTIPLGEFSHENGVRQLRRAGISNEEWRNMEPEARQALIDKWQGEGHDIFRMKVPQSLKDQALKKGFSMFEDAGPAGAAVNFAAHTGEGNVGSKFGGLGGGAGTPGMEKAQATAARVAGAVKPLPGLPQKPLTVGGEHYIPGPIGSVHDVAKKYMESTGRPYQRLESYKPVDVNHAKAIAQAYDEMKHAPTDPKVRASYDAMIKETTDQYRALKDSGLKIDAIEPGMKDPYAETPRLAQKDVAENNHLWFFPTESGFGTDAAGRGHPLLKPTGEKLGGRELLANDLFRIVHDYFGHLKEGNGFRAAGEDNAWRTHANMYSDLARPAMTTETRGQNSWLNYGPHGDFNRTASAADTHYAQQKVGLLPDWVMGDSYPGKVDWQDALRGIAHEPAAPAIKKTGLVDERGLPVQGAAYTKEARGILDEIARGAKGAGPMDLSTQGRVPDVPQTPLPRYEPPRGVSERMRDAIGNPDVTNGIASSIKKGAPVADWYHTEPVRRAFFGELGPVHGDREFKRFMDTVAATSPRSDVPTNIRNASYYYGAGSPENLPPKNPYPFGHVAQNLHRQNFETISGAGGWDPLQNPKPASFAANLQGNLSPVTVDTHAFRNIAMRTNDPRFLETSLSQKYKPGVNRAEDSMVRKYGEVRGDTVVYRPQQLYKEGKLTLEEAKNIPSFWATKPKDNEYGAAEDLFRSLAKKAKLAPADAQAAAWAGAGDLTGLGTVGTHTFPELMNERVLFTSRMRGESPQKTLSDFIRRKKPLLSDASFGSLAPRGREQDQR
jgi:hypothetical protein